MFIDRTIKFRKPFHTLKIGYACVPTLERNMDMQMDALRRLQIIL